MFSKSWATGRSKNSSSNNNNSSSTYPGNRSANNAAVSPVRGSVRAPPSSGDGASRQEHLDSYLKDDVLGRSTMKVSTDDTTYDTVFSTVSGDTLILRVHFPALAFQPGFSSVRAPEMKLTGVVAEHPWLDGIGRVTGFDLCASDKSFRDSKLLLGAAVKQVVQELQLHPPRVTQFQDEHLKKLQANNNRSTSSTSSNNSSNAAPPSYDTLLMNNNNNNNSNNPQPPSDDAIMTNGGGTTSPSANLDLPPIPNEYPELQLLDRTALEELTRDSTVFTAFTNSLPIAEEMQAAARQNGAEAATLATNNLQEQAALQELHNETTELHQQLQRLVTEFTALEREQDALQERPSAHHVLRELQRAKKQAFDASEQVADDWLDAEEECEGTMPQFCTEFLERRKIHHLRAAKMQILTAQEQ